MNHDKVLALAKKLKALAERGMPGEKDKAEKMLNDLLKKHNLTIEEIEDEKVEMHFFDIPDGSVGVQLLNQVIGLVNPTLKMYGKFPKEVMDELNLGGNHSIECTMLEYVEIEGMFSFYLQHYTNEVELFFYAFCKKNNLLIQPGKDESSVLYTDEEYRKYLKALVISRNITGKQYRKQIK